MAQKGDIPLYLKSPPHVLEHVAEEFRVRHKLPLPKEPLDGMFMGEECAGVDAVYRWAPRYEAWVLVRVEPFCGLSSDEIKGDAETPSRPGCPNSRPSMPDAEVAREALKHDPPPRCDELYPFSYGSFRCHRPKGHDGNHWYYEDKLGHGGLCWAQGDLRENATMVSQPLSPLLCRKTLDIGGAKCTKFEGHPGECDAHWWATDNSRAMHAAAEKAYKESPPTPVGTLLADIGVFLQASALRSSEKSFVHHARYLVERIEKQLAPKVLADLEPQDVAPGPRANCHLVAGQLEEEAGALPASLEAKEVWPYRTHLTLMGFRRVMTTFLEWATEVMDLEQMFHRGEIDNTGYDYNTGRRWHVVKAMNTQDQCFELHLDLCVRDRPMPSKDGDDD